jgi:hypothetical protein
VEISGCIGQLRNNWLRLGFASRNGGIKPMRNDPVDKKFMRGQKVRVRLQNSAPGKDDGGTWDAEFVEYIGKDQCRVKWPRWSVGYSPQDVVDLDEVRKS